MLEGLEVAFTVLAVGAGHGLIAEASLGAAAASVAATGTRTAGGMAGMSGRSSGATGGSGGIAPTHTLTINMTGLTQQVIVDITTARPNVEQYGINATYTLTEIATSKVVVTGQTFSRVSYDTPGQQQRFARARGLRDAENRAAQVIAVATEGNEEIAEHADDVLFVPRSLPLLSSVLAVVPLFDGVLTKDSPVFGAFVDVPAGTVRAVGSVGSVGLEAAARLAEEGMVTFVGVKSGEVSRVVWRPGSTLAESALSARVQIGLKGVELLRAGQRVLTANSRDPPAVPVASGDVVRVLD